MQTRFLFLLTSSSILSIAIICQSVPTIHVILSSVLAHHAEGLLTVDHNVPRGPTNNTIASFGGNKSKRARAPELVNSSSLKAQRPLKIYNETPLASNSSNTSASAPFNEASKPTLVLHIGPHKTATSTIQCELSHYRNFLQNQGNVTYAGRHYVECDDGKGSPSFNRLDFRAIISCLNRNGPDNPCAETKEWRRFHKILSSLAKDSYGTLVMSDEAFSRMKYKARNLELLLSTIQRYFHLRLVVYHRHYYSLLLSQYNEHYKPWGRRQFFQEWPGEGGKHIRPFVEYYTKYQNQFGLDKSSQSAADKCDYQLAADRERVHLATYLQSRWTDPTLPSAVQDV